MTKRMDEIRPSSLFSLQTTSSRCFPATKRKLNLSTMITQNHSDFIIAVIGNSIKREGERQKHPRYIIVSRMFRFLSPTKLNRYEQAVLQCSSYHSTTVLSRSWKFISYSCFEALKERAHGARTGTPLPLL